MKSLFKVALLSVVLASISCTHRNVAVTKISDEDISCEQIRFERVQLEQLLGDIDRKTGFSGRNVGMALIFWPGIFVNEMNATDAKALANERMEVLVSLSDKKGCSSKTKK